DTCGRRRQGPRVTDNWRDQWQADLEAGLAAAALAWPDGQPPVQSIQFSGGKLTLVAGVWSADQIERFRASLRSSGWSVESAGGRLVLTRAADGARGRA
ncbi:MAG TPA: type II secretion system protein GspL, partial [Burkholderiaceae bacterium]|nr:type II secretion system protein GspL [Burkholderiaceae bacterium]